ncbi:Glycine cleavage system H protein [Rubripirellula amarantea]|uniref:Glycine cleavage system H protein n=1 Tax=Rubripirellula amarantea TaxID=2527999 RepID=A0A5C5WUY7_9BACT|nr:glycine cleavage system protein H [Rubripirellula amarantea]TWT54069.1 Glycine cleavage system H protein [Rubripirellula amarantea]
MGEHLASFPTDLLYATNHMWAKAIGDGVLRFGLTAYAVRLLQDVYFLDWTVEVGMDLKSRASLGSIESKKAESDLYAPLAGKLVGINEAALDDPSIINAETYSDGWLFDIQTDSCDSLLSPSAYLEHLDSAWDVAQRTIKGQANE